MPQGTFLHEADHPSVMRMSIRDRKVEQVVDLKDFRQTIHSEQLLQDIKHTRLYLKRTFPWVRETSEEETLKSPRLAVWQDRVRSRRYTFCNSAQST